MAKFRIDYDKVIRQASKLEGYAKDLDRERVVLYNHKVELDDGWSGPASLEYLKKLEDLRSSIGAAANEVRNIAQDIRRVAYDIQKEDEEVAERAKKLSQSGGGSSGGGGSSRSF